MDDRHHFLLKTLTQVNNNTSKWLVIFYHPQHERVFFPLNNSLGNKWFNFKTPFRTVCTIIPFPTCSLIKYLKPIMLKYYHVPTPRRAFRPRGEHLACNSTSFLGFSIIFPILSHNIPNATWITTSFNCK
jgi:hypothetical protein